MFMTNNEPNKINQSDTNKTKSKITNSKFLRSHEASQFFGVSQNTIRQWHAKGYISAIRINGASNGHRLFDITSFKGTINNPTKPIDTNSFTIQTQNFPTLIPPKKGVIYCRVSSRHQKDDLDRQITRLSTTYPTYEVIKDIASGINFKRPGFLSLIQRVIKGDFNEVVVAHKDRFTRFGFEFFEWFFEQYQVGFVVLDKTNFQTPEQELSEDLLSIVHIFSSKQNGYTNKPDTKSDTKSDIKPDTKSDTKPDNKPDNKE
jgi:predicted site-specific integrase-resolvase